MLYPQNGDGIVAIDTATSFRPIYKADEMIDELSTVRVCTIKANRITLLAVSTKSENEYKHNTISPASQMTACREGGMGWGL